MSRDKENFLYPQPGLRKDLPYVKNMIKISEDSGVDIAELLKLAGNAVFGGDSRGLQLLASQGAKVSVPTQTFDFTEQEEETEFHNKEDVSLNDVDSNFDAADLSGLDLENILGA